MGPGVLELPFAATRVQNHATSFVAGEEIAKGAGGVPPRFGRLLRSGGGGVATPLGAARQVSGYDIAGTE